MSDLLISAVARRSCVLSGRRRKLKKISSPEKTAFVIIPSFSSDDAHVQSLYNNIRSVGAFCGSVLFI